MICTQWGEYEVQLTPLNWDTSPGTKSSLYKLILKISVNWDKLRLIGTKFSQFRRKVLLIRENSNIFGEIHLNEDKNSVVLCKS